MAARFRTRVALVAQRQPPAFAPASMLNAAANVGGNWSDVDAKFQLREEGVDLLAPFACSKQVQGSLLVKRHGRPAHPLVCFGLRPEDADGVCHYAPTCNCQGDLNPSSRAVTHRVRSHRSVAKTSDAGLGREPVQSASG
jgi:hypothetical protein